MTTLRGMPPLPPPSHARLNNFALYICLREHMFRGPDSTNNHGKLKTKVNCCLFFYFKCVCMRILNRATCYPIGRLYDLCLSYHPTLFLWYFFVIVCLPSLLVSGFMSRLDDMSREKGPLSYHPISLIFFLLFVYLHCTCWDLWVDWMICQEGPTYIDILSCWEHFQRQSLLCHAMNRETSILFLFPHT